MIAAIPNKQCISFLLLYNATVLAAAPEATAVCCTPEYAMQIITDHCSAYTVILFLLSEATAFCCPLNPVASSIG